MAKFNLFDEHTWDIELEDREKLLRNKALGQLGQLISEIRALRDTIEESHVDAQQDNDELKLALTLQKSNSVAFKLMGVSITYPDLEIAEVTRLINQILEFWSDKETREANWRHAVNLVKPLKPYLDKGYVYFYKDARKEAVNNLTSVKVVGNAAWEVYKTAESRSSYWYAKYNEIKPATVYESDDSTDDLGDDDSADTE